MHSLLLAAAGLLAVVTLPSCSDGDSCSSSLRHFYAAGCAISVGGSQLSESEAISGCQENRQAIIEAGCGSQYNAVLRCLGRVSQAACSTCDFEFDSYNSCLNNVPGSWTCPASFYGSDDGCDCGCGALDPDCTGGDTCTSAGCCSAGSCPTDCTWCGPTPDTC